MEVRLSKRRATVVVLSIAAVWYVAIQCTSSLALSSAGHGKSPVPPRPPAIRDSAGNGKWGSTEAMRPPAATAAAVAVREADWDTEEPEVRRGEDQGRDAGSIELRTGTAVAGGGTSSAGLPPQGRQDGAREGLENFDRAGDGGPPGQGTIFDGPGGEKLSGAPAGKQWPVVLPNAGRSTGMGRVGVGFHWYIYEEIHGGRVRVSTHNVVSRW